MRHAIRYMTRVGAVLALGVLAACSAPAPDPAEETLPDMGDFRLGYNIVVADNMRQVPPSREATEQEWIDAMTAEIDRRFSGYQGERLYHIAIHVDGYSLAVPGIPILVAPRSILVISANVWDDERQIKLNADSEQLTVFEGASAASFIGSGLVRSREEQMQVLARNAARRVQLWMLQHPEWFSIGEASAAAGQAALEAQVAANEQPPAPGDTPALAPSGAAQP